jgi:hypothetical protein
MADIVYSIDNLYRQAFPDLASKPLAKLEGTRDVGMAKLDEALGNGFKLGKVQTIVQGDELSYLGTPIFQPITFLGGMYPQLGTGADAGKLVELPYVGWVLPATTTAEFTRAKDITKSAPNGAFGSTKEVWAFGDWDITIRGLILDGQPNFFPKAQLRELASWEKVVDAIDVTGDMFTYLGIKRLVIESINIGRVNGMPNVIPFQMQCVSDEPLELAIQSNQLPQAQTNQPPQLIAQ